MTAAKSTAKVGDLLKVADPAAVRRPDGIEITVTGGSYVLTQAGTYVVDGENTEVKK